jgi:hypothetical protein
LACRLPAAGFPTMEAAAEDRRQAGVLGVALAVKAVLAPPEVFLVAAAVGTSALVLVMALLGTC